MQVGVVEDRVDDEIDGFEVPPDDGPDLRGKGALVPVFGIVAEPEIRAVKKLAVIGVRDDKKEPDLAAVQGRPAVFGDAVKRQVESCLEPLRDTIRPLRDAVE